MSRATGILNKVNGVMRRFTPLTRTLYKRTVTTAGGDELIGRPGSVTNTDTILDPQPIYSPIGRKTVAGGHDKVQPIMGSTGQRTADDYKFTMSPTALSLAELQARNLCLVFKDDLGAEEVLYINDFAPLGLNDTVVAIVVFAGSVKRA